MASACGGQLPLNIRPLDDATFDNLVVHPGVAAVRAAVGDPDERLLFLHGPDEGGKSHLLQAACHACDGVALYLPLASIADLAPTALLEGVENVALICLDDLQAVAGEREWELALFNLYNAVQAAGARMLVAANAPPATLGISLPDLRSRFAAMLVYSVPAPNDLERQDILIARARQRGLSMPVEVARYISHRAGRSPGELMAVLEHLDRASLTHQRALSIPFVRQMMGWRGGQVP